MEEITLSPSELAERGGRYTPVRKVPPDLLLGELRECLGLHGQNWTGPFDRSYQYEFFIVTGRTEVSLIVEISAVVPIAWVGFGYMESADYRTIRAQDEPEDPAHLIFQESAGALLRSRGFKCVSRGFLSQRVGDRTHRQWLIHDPED